MSKRKLDQDELKSNPDDNKSVVINESEDDDESEDEVEESESEYDSDDDKKKKKPKKPTAKRSPKKPAAKKVKLPTFDKLLASLSQDEVIKTVTSFFEVRHPELKEEFFSCVPPPSVRDIEIDLNCHQSAINRAFPHSRYGSDRDHFSYKRVAGHISKYKAAFNKHSKKLIDAKLFNLYLKEFFPAAVENISELPKFDKPDDNKNTILLYKKVVTNATSAIKNCTLTKDEFNKLLTNIKESEVKELEPLIQLVQNKISTL